MEKEKHDPSSSKEKPRKRKECVIPDEYRCQRKDRKKNWQCQNARVNHNYCQHHIDLTTKNYLARRERNKQDPNSSCEKNPKVDKEDIAMEDHLAFTRQKDSSQAVGITKRAMSNMSLIRNPEIAQEIMVPSNISDLKDLLPAIMMEAWNRELTPDEKHSVDGLLPEAHRNDAAVMSIFCEETSRFGIDHAGKWCKSICEGKGNPDAVLQKERKLKNCQSQYLKDLKEYHDGFISKAEELKWLCFNTCKKDDKLFRKELEKNEHDLTVLKL